MPIREYFCQLCNYSWESLQKINDADPIDCPACHDKNSIKRKLSAPAIHVKGTGTYKKETVPEFSVEFNPQGKTHDEQFKVSERTPAVVKEIHEKNIELTKQTAEKFRVEKVTKGTIDGKAPPTTPTQLF
jgi:putative FmdB family regulatory protein